jgi:putative ATP-dependent endonuclease of OLD family
MYVSELNLVNYRNFKSAQLTFGKGVNTILGENGSGKTNVFRAMRLLLDDSMMRHAYRLDETDFHRGLDRWQGHWIVIGLEFREISSDEVAQALFLHGTGNVADTHVETATYNLIFRPNLESRQRLSMLQQDDAEGLNKVRDSITINDYETVFTGRSTADFTDPEVYKRLVGDFDNVIFPSCDEWPAEIGSKIPAVLSVAKEMSLTFIQALRDVVADFQSNRGNPLRTLMRLKSGEIQIEDFDAITATIDGLNSSIEQLNDVRDVTSDIISTVQATAGEAYSPTSMSIKSGLPSSPEKLLQSLKLFIGESDELYEGGVDELSLGGANLVYLTLKLLEFQYRTADERLGNFLLIEEPEAHIHTHIQKTLFENLKYNDTQIIYSTHSPQISEVSNVVNMNILAKANKNCEVFQPSAGLEPHQVVAVQRYLDAVRSNLLFAKSVVLIEGDAEEILIPTLVKDVLGISLDELGVSLINIRSTGFENVAQLFHDERIRKRCSIVTDLDRDITSTVLEIGGPSTEAPTITTGSEKSGRERASRLSEFCEDNTWLDLHFATHTFEVDFMISGNANYVIETIDDVYADDKTRATARLELASEDVSVFGKRILTMAKYAGKGWYALTLAKYTDAQTIIPEYIIAAVAFACGPLSPKVLHKIATHRLDQSSLQGNVAAGTIISLRAAAEEFASGAMTRDEWLLTLDLLPDKDQTRFLMECLSQ